MRPRKRDGRATLREVFEVARESCLSAHESRLWTVYRSYDTGEGAWPGDETLAAHMGKSVRAVQGYRAGLLAKGYLVQELRGPKEAVYRAILPEAPQDPAKQDSGSLAGSCGPSLAGSCDTSGEGSQEASQEGVQDPAPTPGPPIEDEYGSTGSTGSTLGYQPPPTPPVAGRGEDQKRQKNDRGPHPERDRLWPELKGVILERWHLGQERVLGADIGLEGRMLDRLLWRVQDADAVSWMLTNAPSVFGWPASEPHTLAWLVGGRDEESRERCAANLSVALGAYHKHSLSGSRGTFGVNVKRVPAAAVDREPRYL